MWMKGLSLVGQRVRLLVADAAGQGQAARDFFVVVELLQVFGIGDEGDPPIAALRSLADVDQLDAVGSGRHFRKYASESS